MDKTASVLSGRHHTITKEVSISPIKNNKEQTMNAPSINKRQLTTKEVVEAIRSRAEQIEAHMDEGGEISRENMYDMCKHIKILYQLNQVNEQAFEDVVKRVNKL